MIRVPVPSDHTPETAVLQIGPHSVATRVVLAPMVGVTDQPFRQLCARLGTQAGIAEMISADRSLWGTRKSHHRLTGRGGFPLLWVQIAGNDPAQMADAARAQADLGAHIIDINMGCPAKNVCGKGAGSALLRDETLVASILSAVVAAVPELPVTLKMRTGWSPELRNGVRIARIAQDSGIRLLSVHGRTRACRFEGEAEFDTVREIVSTVQLPVLANGDIRSSAQASAVLARTGAAGVMIGRAAQGRPWLCGSIDAALAGKACDAPAATEIDALLLEHIELLHAFYGEQQGLRIARKHAGWYLADTEGERQFLRAFHQIDSGKGQLAALRSHFLCRQQREALAA
jgi:tRNA-dihydrouridine synthase B